MASRYFLFPASLLFAGMTACASVPADWGSGDVVQAARDRGRELSQPADAAAFTRAALARPLTADIAVQLALLNNPDLRLAAARLGIAAAQVYEAGRLANPVFSGAYLQPRNEGSADIRLGIAFNFVSLLVLPANTRFASAQFEAVKLEVASSALNLAAAVEDAYFKAVGADQLAQMRALVARSARVSAELVQRHHEAGNSSRRELAMEQAAATQALLDELSARAEAVEARSELNRAMGLSAAQDTWQLDARLAEPLKQDDELDALLALAVESRLDLAAARMNAKMLATRFGFDRRARWVDSIQVGVERERDGGEISIGPTLEWELPLFNWGTGRVAAARAALDRAEAELDALVLDVSNAVKLAHAKIASASARAEAYRTALVPQRETVVAEAQKEQNYMLIGPFELLLAKQQEYDAYSGYLEALRDYWTARAELTRAVGRKLPSSEQAATATLAPVELARPKGDGETP
ncbi:MAG: TolC family protein [Panacagrimonas sp.]